MLVIGIGNKARHGKDTAGRRMAMMAMSLRMNARVYGFADALRAYCRVAFGMREKDASLLQYVGTDIFRKRDPEIWVRVLLDTIQEQSPDVAIVTDMRFLNEADAIRQLGGYTVNVSRMRSGGELWVSSDRDPLHPSETNLDGYPFDYHIRALDGDVWGLEATATTLFSEILDAYQKREVRNAIIRV